MSVEQVDVDVIAERIRGGIAVGESPTEIAFAISGLLDARGYVADCEARVEANFSAHADAAERLLALQDRIRAALDEEPFICGRSTIGTDGKSWPCL